MCVYAGKNIFEYLNMLIYYEILKWELNAHKIKWYFQLTFYNEYQRAADDRQDV